MQQPTRLISTPFAQEGDKTEIQNVTGEFDNSATYRLGFPPLTMQSIRLGGKPPKGTDFNGVLFDITENISFLCKGGRYQYNAGLSTLIGGYPEGSNLLLDDNVTEVVSTVAGNQNNPNINMTGWILKPNKTTAEYVLDASGETQQQVNYNGGAKWHSRVGGYFENERVVLANGDIVKSTIDGNVNDPNVNMTGWVKVNDASQIFDGSKSQRSINLSIINYANPKMFGGVGDGITDDAQAIRDCFNYMLANDAIFYDYSNSVYKFNSDILVSAPNKRIDIRTNCSFISDTSLFKVSGSITDLGSLTTVAAKGSKSITESFGVSAGDLIAIHNTVIKSFANHRDYYTDGEFKTVLSVSGGVITFNQPLETSYAGVSTDKFYKISPVELYVNGLSVESNGAGAFNLSLAYKCELNNTNVRNLLNASNSNYAAQFDRVVDSKINGGEYIKRGISGTGTDYGISFANCQDIENRASYVYGGRHAVATGGTALPASVPCRRIQTLFTTLENDPLSALHTADFHGNTSDSFYQNCTIYGRVGLGGFNNSSRYNTIYSHAGDVRMPIGYTEVVGGVLESVGDTILSTAAASNIAGWLTSSEIVNTVKPTTFKLQDIKFNGNASLIGILSAFNMATDSRLIVDGFEITDSSNTITRLVTYTAGSSAIKPSYIQITRPNYAVPGSVLYIAGDATLTTTIKNVFTSSGTGANGSWIKQSDGSMICRQRLAATLPIDTAIAGGFKSANITWTLPKIFIAAPSLTAMGFDNSSFAVRGVSTGTSAVQLYAINPISIASAGINFDVIAIGRHLS